MIWESNVELPRRAAQVIWRETTDGIVLVDPKSGMVRVLNPMGSYVWKALDSEQRVNLGQLVKTVCNEFAVSAEIATRDISSFLDELLQRNLLTHPTVSSQ